MSLSRRLPALTTSRFQWLSMVQVCLSFTPLGVQGGERVLTQATLGPQLPPFWVRRGNAHSLGQSSGPTHALLPRSWKM